MVYNDSVAWVLPVRCRFGINLFKMPEPPISVKHAFDFGTVLPLIQENAHTFIFMFYNHFLVILSYVISLSGFTIKTASFFSWNFIK